MFGYCARRSIVAAKLEGYTVGVTKQSNAVTSNGIKIQEVKKNPNERKNKKASSFQLFKIGNFTAMTILYFHPQP